MKNISLKLQNISKSFYGNQLFDCLSFEFNRGVFAILGANGAGKSTLLTMMAGSIPSDTGNIIINDIDIQKYPVVAKRHISYIPDKAMIYPFVKGKEFINFITAIKKCSGTTDTRSLVCAFNLDRYMNATFSEMSLGTQKKFMIVAASIGDPSILIMDEPTNALEQSSREAFIKYLLQHANNKIIIIATHDKQLIDVLDAKQIILEKHPVNKFNVCLDKPTLV